jgi:hypothetical protein
MSARSSTVSIPVLVDDMFLVLTGPVLLKALFLVVFGPMEAPLF